ncbi:hypothetical protein ACMTAS_1511 [Thermotoga neapolitana DSM 4359]|jgi:hypothetical protein
MKSGAENVLLKRILEQPKLENHIRFDKVMTGDQNAKGFDDNLFDTRSPVYNHFR